jgi:hypothetical protein
MKDTRFSRHIPNINSIIVRRNILTKIVDFRTFFARSDRWERTMDTPIIHVNHGKTKSATVRPFQAVQAEILFNQQNNILTRVFEKPITTSWKE